MTKNIIQDMSTLTTIPEKNLSKLGDIITYIISNSIQESILQEKTITEIDVYIGTLYIQHVNTEIKYKFIPNTKLDRTVKDTLNNKLNLLELNLEASLVSKIIDTYKDLL